MLPFMLNSRRWEKKEALEDIVCYHDIGCSWYLIHTIYLMQSSMTHHEAS